MYQSASILFAGVLILLVGCTKPPQMTGAEQKVAAEKAVKSFLELSATASDRKDRVKLRDFCSGEMRRAFDRMTDETFELSYIQNNIKLKEVKILDSNVKNGVATVRYQVAIENNLGSEPTMETNEREVELVLARGLWFLENIKPVGKDVIAFTKGMIF